jgi:hypothetical protein
MALAHCCRYDGQYVYVSSAASTFTIGYFGMTGAVTSYLEMAQIDPATMALVASSVFPSNSDSQFTDALAVTQNFVWCGSEASGNVVKFAKASSSGAFSSRAVISVSALPISGTPCYEVYNDGRYLWLGYESAGYIVRLEPFSGQMDAFALPSGLQGVNSIWGDDTGQNLFLGNWLDGGASVTSGGAVALAALQQP